MILLQAFRPLALDFLSTIVFVVILAITGDVGVAVGSGVISGLAVIVIEWRRGIRPGAIQWMSLALVVVMGATSLLTGDPRYVMAKPTISYAAVGAVMMVPGWMERYIPEIARKALPSSRWVMWGYIWAGLMFLSAALNLALALTLSAEDWAMALAIWGPASKLLLFFTQYAMIRGEVRRQRLSMASEATPISSAGIP